ncbi:MAG: D-alanyl-D-alanine carboxypeptidase [Paracoccaceae bacterium]|nr:D-alanyl-D-alanine carboxypeptidase [Paracoccaceae bacterium]
MPYVIRRLPATLALGGMILSGASGVSHAATASITSSGDPFAAPPSAPAAAPVVAPAKARLPAPVPVAAPAAAPVAPQTTQPVATTTAAPQPAQDAPVTIPGAPPPPPLPDVAAYVLMDAQTGTVIAARDAQIPRAPASLTKLMTAYLTYQAIARGLLKPDQTVPVSTAAWKAGGSRMFISPNMTVTVDQLLHGLIIDSGNDSAVALAEAVGGTQDAFVQSMNAEAAKLGLSGTHYTNVSGLPDPDLHTTALDVAKLSRAIVRDFPQFLQISAQKHYPFNGIRQRSWNPVLFRDPSVDGLKTGQTDAAGHCIDATALRSGTRLIAVELGGPNWSAGTASIEALLDYGYHFFQDATIATAGKPMGVLADQNVTPDKIDVGPAKDLVLTVPTESVKSVTSALLLGPAPIGALPKGTQVGTISYSLGGQVLATVPAVTLTDTRPAGFVTRMIRQLRAML